MHCELCAALPDGHPRHDKIYTLTKQYPKIVPIEHPRLPGRIRQDWYKEYQQSAEWVAKRSARLSYPDANECWACGIRNFKPHVHHLTYQNLGCEHMEELVVTCIKCNMERIRTVAKYLEKEKMCFSRWRQWLASDYIRLKMRGDVNVTSEAWLLDIPTMYALDSVFENTFKL